MTDVRKLRYVREAVRLERMAGSHGRKGLRALAWSLWVPDPRPEQRIAARNRRAAEHWQDAAVAHFRMAATLANRARDLREVPSSSEQVWT